MRKVCKVLHAQASVIVLTCIASQLLSIANGYAEEVSAEKLLLNSTYIKTESANLHFGPSTPAFSTTTVNCPRKSESTEMENSGRAGVCTIRIELSTQFANIQNPDVVGAEVLVDNSQAGVLPNSTLGLDVQNTTSGSSTARTFSWMK